MNSDVILDSDSVVSTQDIGRRLGAVLAPGHVVALIGPLGSGKTTLVKGIADGAGVADPRQVNSPTFVIVNEYQGRALHIYHIDAYRLRDSADLDAIGFEEMMSQGAILLEWADRVAEVLPEDHLTIALQPLAEHRRQLHLTASGPKTQALLAAVQAIARTRA
jgi:tRNA threonylcarbamoyladenosine biosynthesis protein TsaE